MLLAIDIYASKDFSFADSQIFCTCAMLFEPVNGYRLIMFPTILHWLAAKTNEWLSPLFSTVDNKTECAPWQY